MSLTGWVALAVAVLVAARFLLGWLDKREAPPSPARASGAKKAEEPSTTSYRTAVEVIDSLLIALALVFFIVKTFVIQAFWIPTGSMEDTLLIKDRVVVNRFAYRFRPPRRGDIVVFKAPRAADPSGKEFIKRLIGLPGDRVRVERSTPLREGRVFINGEPLAEGYTRQSPNYDFPLIEGAGRRQYWRGLYWKEGERAMDEITVAVEDGMPVTRPDYPFLLGPIEGKDLVIPPDCYLFLGDNRRESHDGHAWGLAPKDSLVGRAEMVFWPIGRWRLLFSPY